MLGRRFICSAGEGGSRRIMRTSLHVSNPIHKTADKDCAFGEDRSGVSPQKRRWAQTEGSPLPLGAIWIEEEQAFNFAVYAEPAESVTLLLYCAEELANPILTFPFDFVRNKSGRIWHCRLPLKEMRGCSLLCLLGLGAGYF